MYVHQDAQSRAPERSILHGCGYSPLKSNCLLGLMITQVGCHRLTTDTLQALVELQRKYKLTSERHENQSMMLTNLKL